MALLSPTDQQRLRESFAAMTSPVRLLFFTQTIGCDTCPETRQILDELPVLSDRITIEEVNLVLDQDKAKQYDVERAPTIAILGEHSDSRIRFLGAPSGYEFISLVQAVQLVGGRQSSLTAENRRRIAEIETPIVMQVFTTPS